MIEKLNISKELEAVENIKTQLDGLQQRRQELLARLDTVTGKLRELDTLATTSVTSPKDFQSTMTRTRKLSVEINDIQDAMERLDAILPILQDNVRVAETKLTQAIVREAAGIRAELEPEICKHLLKAFKYYQQWEDFRVGVLKISHNAVIGVPSAVDFFKQSQAGSGQENGATWFKCQKQLWADYVVAGRQ